MGGRCREGTTAAARSSASKRRGAVRTPSEDEIEEFFASMEGGDDVVRRFNDKYNYDFVRDEPMEGGGGKRYEWVALSNSRNGNQPKER